MGRAVFQSSDWKKVQKRSAPPRIFRDNSSPLEISVFILDFALDQELTAIGDALAAQRAGNRQFHGWAELKVEDAGKDNRSVRATPQTSNPWHADIVLPSTAEANKDERQEHAHDLADMAIPRPRK